MQLGFCRVRRHDMHVQPPALTLAQLQDHLTSGRDQLRDPRELATLWVRYPDAVVVLVDERRFDEAPLNQVVLFSFVSMRGHQALKALDEMAELREKLEAGLYKGAFLRKQLLRGTPGVMGDLAEEWLKSAAITRVLASYEALRRWRDETN